LPQEERLPIGYLGGQPPHIKAFTKRFLASEAAMEDASGVEQENRTSSGLHQEPTNRKRLIFHIIVCLIKSRLLTSWQLFIARTLLIK